MVNVSLIVVRTFVSTLHYLPGAFRVVTRDCRGRPDVSIAGDIAAVIKIVQNSKLFGESVLIRCNVLTVHGQTRIGIAWFKVAKNLIVSPIFLDDVDHMANGIGAAGKGD